MTLPAVVMMLVAVLVVWGGLALAVVNLVRRSPRTPGQGGPPPQPDSPTGR